MEHTVKSFLMIGQSNMAGRGYLHEVKPIVNERIVMLRNGRWQMMAEPINCDRSVAGISLAASFAEAWCHEYKEGQIGLIPCAEGGSEIDEWDVGNALYNHAISEARFAMKNSQLTGILWHQGESDGMGGKHEKYYEKLHRIMLGFRKELDAPNLPIIIGGLGDFLGRSGFGKNCTEYTLINQKLKQFAFENDNCYFVDAADLTCNPDGIHINAVSQRKFGLRYFEAFYRKQHILEPLTNEDEKLLILEARAHTKAEKIFLLSMQMALGHISYRDFEAQMAQTLE
ncbi:sialate O-acetylesterase [Enterocloster lavalensis]|uniref:sialate O-acetylesterase n=1 Tax=Enterocloster lavalensis TaxID=460384 RepID=UPI0026652FE1|nr:sialate O-acetylesterase [Enterocloster lavalensis]